MFKSIRSRLALSFAGIALVAAVALGVVLLAILQDYYSNLELAYLLGNAKSISGVITKMTSGNASYDEVQSQIENLAFLSQTRVQVYDANQRLLYDSGPPQKLGVNLGVAKQKLATQGQTDVLLPTDVKRIISVNDKSNAKLPAPEPTPAAADPTLDAQGAKGVILYRSVQASGSPFGFDLSAEADYGAARSGQIVKQPVNDPKSGNVLGTVVLSEGPAYGRAILTSVAWGWALASAVAVLLAAGVGWVISRRISAPVLVLTGVTTRMAGGDLSSRADVKSQDEFGRLARSFNEMADQVEATVTALRRFVSDAAHELQTPVTALRTNLDLAADENNAADRRVFVERAQAMVKRLEELNDNLLDLSRLEANRHAVQETVVDLTEVLRQRAEVYASQAEQAGLTLELLAPTTPAVIQGDTVQVQRVLDNLVDNACKFTPAGGTINVRLYREGEQVVLSVADTGIGVPDEDLPQLFNRFHRGRNATTYPGSGLGLAIVKAIMDQQGGQVTAENLSTGARFALRWCTVDLMS
jgi:signal transduction histidine kinase